jgi:ABC-2 type transport system permease protein/oleandomycin transport system permease protein
VTVTVDADVVGAERRADLGLLRVLADAGLLAQRNLRKTSRNFRFMMVATIQPMLQLVLFAFVFGGIVDIPNYRSMIVPAVLVQTVTFSATSSGLGIANDLNAGMVERLRSLPIARSAFLVGRIVADAVRLTLQAVLLVAVAGLIGFRFENGFLCGVASVAVIVLLAVALTSFTTWVGFVVREVETVQAATFIPMLPLIFASSAFSPVRNLPAALRPLASWNPVTAAVDTARGLAMGERALVAFGSPDLVTSALHFGLWWVAIVVVFTTLSVRRYRLG